MTIRSFPDVPVVQAVWVIQLPPQNRTVFWEAVTDFHTHLPSLNDAGGSGYYSLNPNPQNETGTLDILGALWYPNKTDTSKIMTLFEPLMAAWNKTVGWSYVNVILLPSTAVVFAASLKDDADTLGFNLATGSRLISRDLIASRDGPARLTDVLSRQIQQPGKGVTGHVVAGGAVARNTSDTAINPAWRRTLIHMTTGVAWDPTMTSYEEQKEIYRNLTEVDVALLKSLEPDMGAYLNEADPNEADFQQSFWGANYPRLYAIKKVWDPTGFFIVRLGVGSEDWIDDGNCRV
jgi:hypothetical protein